MNANRKSIVQSRIDESIIQDTSSSSDDEGLTHPTKRSRSSLLLPPTLPFEGLKAVFLVRDPKDQLQTIGSGWLHIQNFIKGGGETVESLREGTTHVVALPDVSRSAEWTLEEVASVMKMSMETLMNHNVHVVTRSACLPLLIYTILIGHISTWIANSSSAKSPEIAHAIKPIPPVDEPMTEPEDEVEIILSPPLPQIVKNLDETDSQTT